MCGVGVPRHTSEPAWFPRVAGSFLEYQESAHASGQNTIRHSLAGIRTIPLKTDGTKNTIRNASSLIAVPNFPSALFGMALSPYFIQPSSPPPSTLSSPSFPSFHAPCHPFLPPPPPPPRHNFSPCPTPPAHLSHPKTG